MNNQSFFFSIESLLDIHPLENFRVLFNSLNDRHLNKKYTTGRKPFNRQAILRSFIFKNLKSIPTLTELFYTLRDNPSAAIRCGFDITKPIPSIERFSDFLINTINSDLQVIRINLVKELVELKIISGSYLSIDSCPILAKVKENNLKTNVYNRFNKERLCKGDNDAKLGVIVTFAKSKKEISYFWGYRDHVVIDAHSELPVWNITKPANVQDSVMFIPIFNLIQANFNFNIDVVLADGIYDTSAILNYIINTLKAKPRVALNIRNTANKSASGGEIKFSKSGNPFCDAALEMLPRGTFYDRQQNRYRRKWVCPLLHSKKHQYQYIVCPAFHPKFFDQKGCYRLIRVDENIRTKIDYGSDSFKYDFHFRTGSERVFSRLLNICTQNPPVTGLTALSNYITIAHITVLLVALTAAKNNVKDQIRFIKSFLPNFNPSS